MSEVLDRLQQITLQEIEPMLDAKHSADPVAGIAIVNIPNVEVTNEQGLVYHFHGARVFPSSKDKPNFVNPHYHLKGIEPYNILRGENGEMNLGKVVNGEVVWENPRLVKTGDLVIVEEAQVHSLRNTGDMPLDFTFACPDIHLVDNSLARPDGDRYLTKDLKNGIPPQYPKA